jgi:hypothetical protein
MQMRDFRHSPFETTLNVVATMRDTSIRASVKDKLNHGPVEHEAFMRSVVSARDSGIPIGELSNASGLTVEAIRTASV